MQTVSGRVQEQLNMTVSGTYTTVDLADLSTKAVYNKMDGYYHLNSADGPILFIDLTSNSRFVASIQGICGNQSYNQEYAWLLYCGYFA